MGWPRQKKPFNDYRAHSYRNTYYHYRSPCVVTRKKFLEIENMEITQAKLKELLDYNSETGAFRYVSSGTACIGSNAEGYRRIWAYGKRYMLHVLAWLYVYGVLPTSKLDHVNRIRDDNRIDNLREATNKQNSWNRKRSCTNLSGFKGVSADKNRWRATLTVDNKKIRLGRFNTPEEASAAYQAKAREVHGEFHFDGI